MFKLQKKSEGFYISSMTFIPSLHSKLNSLHFNSVQSALFLNLHPDSVEEARQLIPSLQDANEEDIQEAILAMKLFKRHV